MRRIQRRARMVHQYGAVDSADDGIFANSEDGNLYFWNLSTNTFTEKITLTSGVGEAYTPTVVGPDGTVYAINDATLFAVVASQGSSTFQLQSASYEANETAFSAAITVTRTGSLAGGVTVNYATADGTAVVGTNYLPSSGTLVFAAGQTSAFIIVPLLDEGTVWSTKTLQVSISNPGPGGTLGSPTTAVLTVNNNDLTPNKLFINQVYLDLLERPAECFGLDSWTGQLDDGTSRQAVVQGIEDSTEYHTIEIDNLYATLLGRAPDTFGMTSFLRALAVVHAIEQVEAGILASEEYYQVAGGSNSAFLASIYESVLGRSVDPTALANFGAALAEGTLRLTIAEDILTSSEEYQLLVQGYYERFLQRPADAFGLGQFVNALVQGISEEEVVAAIVGSAEFFMDYSS